MASDNSCWWHSPSPIKGNTKASERAGFGRLKKKGLSDIYQREEEREKKKLRTLFSFGSFSGSEKRKKDKQKRKKEE